MLNISRSTQSKDLIFGIHMDILTNFWLSGKNLQLGPLWKKYSDLIEELARKNNELQLPKEHVRAYTD